MATVDAATGRILSERHTADLPDGVIYKPCGNRRESVCPSCSQRYKRDAYQVVRAGLVGGGLLVLSGHGGGRVGEHCVGRGLPARADELQEVHNQRRQLPCAARVRFRPAGLRTAEHDALIAEQGERDRVAAALGEEVAAEAGFG